MPDINWDKMPKTDDDLLVRSAPYRFQNKKLYTGIGIVKNVDGKLKAQYRYVQGLPEGLQQEWYDNGQMEVEAIAVRYFSCSRVTKWYETGQMKSNQLSEFGYVTDYQEWDKRGHLLVHTKTKVTECQKESLEIVKLVIERRKKGEHSYSS